MVTIEEFNAMASDRLRPTLADCCDAPEWIDGLLAARPFADFGSLIATADRLAGAITPTGVDQALSAHPRIGEKRAGADRGAAWSREEQSGVAADVETAAALHSANRLYEKRFGRVFLICATGLSSEEILAAVRARLDNDPDTEDKVVAEELRKIAVLRLRKVIHP
ncbi:2-oxo-4-hydroxy-4-carboxy-5-ureidoimidazoline decarboxylase [Nocardia sp. IFM 10818]